MRDAARETTRDLPIHEILARFELGDFAGALVAAGQLLDEERVPVLVVEPGEVGALPADDFHAALLGIIDGERTIEDVLDASGMSMIDGLRAICELAERGLVVLR
jgi:hypothetical protein